MRQWRAAPRVPRQRRGALRGASVRAVLTREEAAGNKSGCVRPLVNGPFKLIERTVYSQENSFASGILHMFCDSQHPAHGLYFDAEVSRRIASGRAAFPCGDFKLTIQVGELLAEILEPRLECDRTKILSSK